MIPLLDERHVSTKIVEAERFETFVTNETGCTLPISCQRESVDILQSQYSAFRGRRITYRRELALAKITRRLVDEVRTWSSRTSTEAV